MQFRKRNLENYVITYEKTAEPKKYKKQSYFLNTYLFLWYAGCKERNNNCYNSSKSSQYYRKMKIVNL